MHQLAMSCSISLLACICTIEQHMVCNSGQCCQQHKLKAFPLAIANTFQPLASMWLPACHGVHLCALYGQQLTWPAAHRREFAGAAWDEGRAAKLMAMMEAAIQRRFPKGLKVHVCSVDRFGCLAELTRVLHSADLSVTRAKVRTHMPDERLGVKTWGWFEVSCDWTCK